MNIVIMTGNLTSDPERRAFASGGEMAVLPLAVSSSSKDQDGNYKTNFFDVEVFGKAAENCIRYLRKGKKVLITGELRDERWTDPKNNQQRRFLKIRAYKVEFLSPKDNVTVDTLEDVTTDDIPFD